MLFDALLDGETLCFVHTEGVGSIEDIRQRQRYTDRRRLSAVVKVHSAPCIPTYMYNPFIHFCMHTCALLKLYSDSIRSTDSCLAVSLRDAKRVIARHIPTPTGL